MTRRLFARNTPDDRAISVIIGAILLLGLLVAMTVTIRITYVPVWEKDRQAGHMRLVETQLAGLKAELDRQTNNGTAVPAANPLSLGSSGTNMWDRTTNEGRFGFSAATRPFRIQSNQFLIQEENGTSYLGLQETWTPVAGAVNVEEIAFVHSLRLRLASLDQDNAGDAVTITATDADSAFAGDLRVLVGTAGTDDWRINVRVRDASSTILADVALAFPNDETQAPSWLDALRRDYRFDRVLGAAKAPIRLTFATANVDLGAGNEDITAEYACTYLQSGGQAVVGGGGLQKDDYTATYVGGHLAFHAANGEFPPQDFLIESGALVLVQDEGAAFRVDPGFRATLVGTTTALTITVPTLTGRETTFQGSGTAIAYTHTLTQAKLAGQAPRITLTVTTSQPTLWTDFWTDQLGALDGYVDGTHFTTATTTSTATLTVLGLTSDPASTAYDLYVTFRQATINIDLKG